MMQTIALAESTEWPDMKATEEAQARRAEIARRRAEEWASECEKQGLTRQLRLAKAREQYGEVQEFSPIAKAMAGIRHEFDCNVWPDRDTPQWFSVGFSGREYARARPMEYLNSRIPYGVLLAAKTAQAEECFDRLLVLAPLDHYQLEEVETTDPILLGVVDAPTGQAESAVYFEIARWDTRLHEQLAK